MVNRVSIAAIPADQFNAWEPDLKVWFDKFYDKFPTEKTFEGLKKDILDREYQVWAVVGDTPIAFALTYLVDDQCNTCVISHCAGKDYEQWAGQLIATIRVWSHSLGSTKFEIVGRPGWERALRKFGLVKTKVILELKDGQGQNN